MKFEKLAFIAAGLLLILSILVPYLVVIFNSPQYPDRSPVVFIYTDKLSGDLHDWQVVARYIGVKFPPELPEFDMKIISILITTLAVITLAGSFLRRGWKKAIAILLLSAGILMAGWGQYRFYQAGHNLDPRAPLRYAVKPFTPPLIGIVKVHKIRIYHLPYLGFVLFASAVGLTLIASFRHKK